MEETEELQAARAMRRAMLGDAYVDSMTADPGGAEFQDHITADGVGRLGSGRSAVVRAIGACWCWR